MAQYCFGIYYLSGTKEKIITDLSQFNYFIKSRIKELMYTSIKEIEDRTEDNFSIDIELNLNQKIYLVGLKTINTTVFIFTTEPRPHHHLISLAKYLSIKEPAKTIPDNFEFISSFIKMKQIQTEFDEIKSVMIDNIEKLLERGEKLEDLIIKTKHLSDTSKKFLIKSKKLNRCCVIV